MARVDLGIVHGSGTNAGSKTRDTVLMTPRPEIRSNGGREHATMLRGLDINLQEAGS